MSHPAVQLHPRIIRRREKPWILAQNLFGYMEAVSSLLPTAVEWICHILCLLLCMHAVFCSECKLYFCAKAGFSLLLILLGWVRQLAERRELNRAAQNIWVPETDILIP